MLFIEHELHQADRAQGVYRHLPDSLRHRLITAPIVYQCWGLQKRLRKEGRPRESGKLKEVAATSCLAQLGTSGRHHLVDANDPVPIRGHSSQRSLDRDNANHRDDL